MSKLQKQIIVLSLSLLVIALSLFYDQDTYYKSNFQHREKTQFERLQTETIGIETPSLKKNYYLIRHSDGKILEEYQANLKLPLASLAKLYTSSFIRDTLGRDYRFETKIGYHNNDLIISSSGDPSLTALDLVNLFYSFREKSKKNKFKKIILDVSQMPELHKPREDKKLSFDNKHFWSFNLNENYFYLKPKYPNNEKLLFLTFQSQGILDEMRTYVEGNDYIDVRDNYEVFAPFGIKYLSYPFIHPKKILKVFISEICSKLGIKYNQIEFSDSAVNMTTISQHKSETIEVLVEYALKESNNFYISSMGKLAQIQSKHKKSNINLAGGLLFDHVGLSYQNKGSCKNIVDHIKNEDLIPYLALSGFSGTLYERMLEKELNMRVKAKTGTLKYVTNLAGQFYSHSGEKYYFCIMLFDQKLKAKLDKGKLDNIYFNTALWNKSARIYVDELVKKWVRKY